MFINLLYIWFILLYHFVAVICINFIHSHIVCLYGHSLHLLIWDTNVRNVRISNTAHMMSSTFSERFKHCCSERTANYMVRSKIKWWPFVLVSESVYRSWFCVYLRLGAVVQRKTLPPKVTAVDLLDRAIAHEFLRVLTADSRSTRYNLTPKCSGIWG